MTDQSSSEDQKSNDPWARIHPDTLVMSTKDYIVYIAPTIELKWETTDDFDTRQRTDGKFNSAKYYSIFCDAGVLEARVREEFDLDTRKQILCLIGNTLVCSFECDYAAAENALKDARQFLRERSEELSRYWYLSASFAMAALFLALGVLIWTIRLCFEQILGTDALWLTLAAVAGAAGALLSIILRSGKLAFDPSSGQRLHYLEGASRIWAGSLSGVLIALAIKVDFILGALGAAHSSKMLLLVSMAGGASERLATSIISKIDADAGKVSYPTKKSDPNKT